MFRPYQPATDREAVHRVWREVHWIKKDEHAEALDHFLSESNAWVATLNDTPECVVCTTPGTIRYLNQDLSMSGVTAVTTSRIARKQALAGRLTAMCVARDAAAGAAVSALGMFEQGYYDRLGFGTGPYEHWFSFDPAVLQIDRPFRVPERLTLDDWKRVHHALLHRHPAHGRANLNPASIARAEMGWTDNGFGLGYSDGEHLTHFIWGEAGGEHGPYTINAMAYQNRDQFLELMALIKSLGDQIRLVRMREPGGIQMQDFLRQPFKHEQITEKSKFEQVNKASAYWQIRICDLHACLAETRLPDPAARFNLDLDDPITAYLPDDAPWRGLTGQYTVTLGPTSSAEPGTDPTLPILTASVGAFTRLWFGVRPATGLAITDTLSGPDNLLKALDKTLRLPKPHLDWEF